MEEDMYCYNGVCFKPGALEEDELGIPVERYLSKEEKDHQIIS